MERYEFLVKGSASDPYQVSFSKDGTTVLAFCSCPAGKNGQYCKHRLGILAGSIASIVSENTADVGKVAAWLPGSEIETALAEIARLEDQAEALKKEIIYAKKVLAKIMMG